MFKTLRPLPLALGLGALLVLSTAGGCAHASAAPDPAALQARDLDWAIELGRYVARTTAAALLFTDGEAVKNELSALDQSDRVLFAVVRSPKGKEIGRWGKLPEGTELPAAGTEELRVARAGQGLVRIPIVSDSPEDGVIGDLVLVVRTAPGA